MGYFYASQATDSPTSFVASTTTSGNDISSGTVGLEAGYKFVVGASALTVSALGGKRHSGTSGDYTVRIRDNSGTLIAEALIDYDSVAVTEWAYTSVTPVVLSAGATYHITATRWSWGVAPAGTATLANVVSTADGTITDFTNQLQSPSSGVVAFVSFLYTL